MRTAGRMGLMFGMLALILAAVAVACDQVKPAPTPPPGLSSELRRAVTPGGVLEHTRRFQAIADENGGNRAAGTPGYDASADYVANELREAGYDVTVQGFEFPSSSAVRDAGLALTGDTGEAAREYVQETDFALMQRSGVGEVEARLRPVDPESPTSGCEAEDFGGFFEGNVALMRRGTCTFETKAENALRAGASAALIFNAGEPDDEVLRGALGGQEVGLPVMGTSAAVGRDLLSRQDAPEVRIFAGETANNRTTNIIAQTRGGNEAETVMVGAHLDSVPQGPGINDNASGSATVLEIALKLAEADTQPRNRVRFAFWGAEEIGLLGSSHYVEDLDEDQLEDISAYLNFDMVGSPNYVRTVYEGPDGIEDVFTSYFENQNIEVETNPALDGRSDHGPFQDEGVPTGGLFSGAGGSKSGAQAEKFGGEAGVPFDGCYHEGCDDVGNLSRRSLDQLSDGAAHAAAVLAERPGA